MRNKVRANSIPFYLAKLGRYYSREQILLPHFENKNHDIRIPARWSVMTTINRFPWFIRIRSRMGYFFQNGSLIILPK